MKKKALLGWLVLLGGATVFGQTAPVPHIVKEPAASAQKTDLSELIGLTGQTAPTFALAAMDGTEYDLEKLRGKIVVINLWATFCPPCLDEMPKLNALVENYRGKDAVFLAPTPDDKAILPGFLKQHRFDYQVLPNGFNAVKLYSPQRKPSDSQQKGKFLMLFPVHLVIDRNGAVAYHSWGSKENVIAELSAEIEKQLAKPASPPEPAKNEKSAPSESANFKSASQIAGNLQASDRAAIEILEKHVVALGGREAFARIKSIETEIERQVLGRTIKAKRVDDIAGNRSYNRQDGGGGVIETGFDGKRAWQKAPFFRGYLDAASPQAKALTRGGARLPGAALYDYKASDKKFSRLPDEKLADGKNYPVLKSSYADETGKETSVKYYFDPATYLVKQTVSGNAVTQTETFDDYRAVGGIKVAFASVIANPQATITSKIIDLKFNAPLDAAIFEFQESSAQPAQSGSKSGAVKETNRAESSPRVEASVEISEATRLATFEIIWKTINDTFYDRSFNGVNWQTVHDRYLPLAKTAAKSDDFHRLLNRMVQELHLSHFKVNAPKNVLTLSSAAANANNGSVGIALQWIDNQLLVARVEKDSPARVAGVRPGFVVRKINCATPEELYARYKKDNPGFQLREELARVRAASSELAGKPDEKITLELLDARDDSLKFEIARRAVPPGRRLEFESKRLAGNVGYVKFNLFFGDLLPKFQAALDDLRETRGLIIDLRGNPGGAGDLAPALANLLCADAGSLGSLKYRYETVRYSYAGAGKQAYRGKIIVLTDEGTGSTAEVFAGGLQANKRAVVVGSQSAGAVLPSMIQLLPTGGALQYVVSDFQTASGVALEGKGVAPDVTVKISRADLLAQRDAVLERATAF